MSTQARSSIRARLMRMNLVIVIVSIALSIGGTLYFTLRSEQTALDNNLLNSASILSRVPMIQEALQGERTIEELSEWVIQHRLEVCHWFTVDVFDHLRRGGRVSAGTAVLGTALQIKPLLHVNQNGELAVVEKPRGRKQAIKAQLAKMEQGWLPEMGRTVVVGHGACPDGAQALQEAVQERFPEAKVLTADIGPIIGAHTGPGMLALIYWGNTR